MAAPASAVERLVREVTERLTDPIRVFPREEMQVALADLLAARKVAADSVEIALIFAVEGQIFFYLRDLAAALTAFKNATNNASHVAIYWSNLACAYLDCGDVKAALKAIEHARTRQTNGRLDNVVIAFNYAEMVYRSGAVKSGRAAFAEAMRKVDETSSVELFYAASAASAIGYEDDAVELLARCVAAGEHTDRGHGPAVDFLRSHTDALAAAQLRSTALRAAVAAVFARYDAPSEDEYRTAIELSPRASAQLEAMLDDSTAPTEALRRLFDARRA